MFILYITYPNSKAQSPIVKQRWPRKRNGRKDKPTKTQENTKQVSRVGCVGWISDFWGADRRGSKICHGAVDFYSERLSTRQPSTNYIQGNPAVPHGISGFIARESSACWTEVAANWGTFCQAVKRTAARWLPGEIAQLQGIVQHYLGHSHASPNGLTGW